MSSFIYSTLTKKIFILQSSRFKGYAIVKDLKIVKEARQERARQAERQRVAARQVK